eukprot:9663940-Alexandrium_andersonii.AAC.1
MALVGPLLVGIMFGIVLVAVDELVREPLIRGEQWACRCPSDWLKEPEKGSCVRQIDHSCLVSEV